MKTAEEWERSCNIYHSDDPENLIKLFKLIQRGALEAAAQHCEKRSKDAMNGGLIKPTLIAVGSEIRNLMGEDQ